MRKFTTFTIVLLVQLSIIYGLYRWYVSDRDEKEPVKQSAAIENKDRQIPEQQLEQKQQIPKSTKPESGKPEKSNNENVSAAKPVQSKNIASTANRKNILSKPLIYKNAEWGNIPSLPNSKLAATGILVNVDSRKVLWAKNCRKSVPIASMTKMMTELLAFEATDNNPDISLSTEIKVTNEAYKIGGSQVWLDPRESFTLKELLKSIMIKSANDSAYLVAQYLGGGDISTFINRMNEKAKEIGMPNAHFSNPDGLPEKSSADDNRATAEGLVFLAEYLRQYPLANEWAKTKIAWFREGSKNPTMLVNTNHLIRNDVTGVTGMKTGYTVRSGFCLTATCTRGGKNMIAVVTGFKSRKARDLFVKQLLDWGYKKDAKIKNSK
jgi:serine-type D-Ala-D-Ala carboxypeptidase (penicillin-binding protein 5/6)